MWKEQCGVLDKYKVTLEKENIDYQKQLQEQKSIHASAIKQIEEDTINLKTKNLILEDKIVSLTKEMEELQKQNEVQSQGLSSKEIEIKTLNSDII